MATLKDLRVRITSVKSTQKITSAMKMVAASKLRRAQTQAEAARPYAQRMERMLASLGASVAGSPSAPRLLAGTGADKVHLLVPVTGDRGLAGAFNTNAARMARNLARKLETEGKTVKILSVGRKGRDYLRRELPGRLIGDISFAGKKTVSFADAQEVATRITQLLDDNAFDVCTVVYNRFQSVISQIPTEMRLIPAPLPAEGSAGPGGAIYEYEAGDPDEPDQEVILARLLPQNLAIQVYRALLENSAGFYGAQMTSMDNATRNAGDMIKRLTLNYNRARQANITKELIEIISGAEAV
jgi:F-type H+-transporting ATPase subunit gamma